MAEKLLKMLKTKTKTSDGAHSCLEKIVFNYMRDQPQGTTFYLAQIATDTNMSHMDALFVITKLVDDGFVVKNALRQFFISDHAYN